MASVSVPTLSGLKSADDAQSNASLVMRDANGDSWTRSFRSNGPSRALQGEYKGVSATKTVNFTLDDTARFWQCDAAAGTITATLPAAASSAGLRLTLKKLTGTNSLILKGSGAELVDGVNTKTATAQWAAISVYCDGVAWFIESVQGTWS